MNTTTDIRKHYLKNFKLFDQRTNGNPQSPIHILRQKGIDDFLQYGFPMSSDEEWRFTNIAPITRTPFLPVPSTAKNDIAKSVLEQHLISGMAGSRLTFVNGHFISGLSELKSDTIRIQNLAAVVNSGHESIDRYLQLFTHSEKNAFTFLNTGFLYDGSFIVIPDNMIVEQPIYLLFIAKETPEPAMIQPRNILIVGKNSKVSIVEQFVSLTDSFYLTNTITQIVAGENSFIEHTKIQTESLNAFHIGSTQVQQQSGSNFTSHSMMLGGAIVRNNITAILEAEHIECTLNGLSLTAGNQLIDNHTIIDHAHPYCDSHELFKAILDGSSRGVFNGKIYVRKDAQKTNARQTNKTLLLSDQATMNTKPQLEIFADDVKCTHGATIGYLDSEMIFYLRSRGIGIEEARDLLIHAFASDITKRISDESVQRYIDALIFDRLGNKR